MFSTAKKLDRELLLEIGEMIKVLIKVNNTESLDLAEKFGDHYVALSDRVKNFDYTHLDEIHTRADGRMK